MHARRRSLNTASKTIIFKSDKESLIVLTIFYQNINFEPWN